MSRPATIRATRSLFVQSRPLTTGRALHIRSLARPSIIPVSVTGPRLLDNARHLSVTSSKKIDLTGDGDKDTPKESEPHDDPKVPASLSEEEYHQVADTYLNTLVEELEKMHENGHIKDVEYSVSACGRVSMPINLIMATLH